MQALMTARVELVRLEQSVCRIVHALQVRRRAARCQRLCVRALAHLTLRRREVLSL